MGSLEVRNLLLSKKLKRAETRLLIIDDNQIRYNDIVEIFQSNQHPVQATLLDDLKSFEKQLNTQWDLVIFGRAYDIKIEQALVLIQSSSNSDIPFLLIRPEEYKDEQYMSYIHKGIYEVLELENTGRSYTNLVRALSYSRSLQVQKNLSNHIENAKLQKIELAEEQNKAVAVIQEGIHIQANAEYLSLFGLSREDEIVGLPLLDILQPQKISDFKSRFKKVTQGHFEHGRFDIETQNTHALASNPLKIEFLAAQEDDAIQITIETESSKLSTNTPPQSPSPNLARVSVYQKMQRYVENQPAKENAIILYSLANCPAAILSSDWSTFKGYFDKMSEFIKAQTNGTVFKIETALYATILQAESTEILNSRLTGLLALEKPQLVNLGDQTYQQNIKIGYSIFKPDQVTETSFLPLIEQAYNTHLPKNSIDTELELTELAQVNLNPAKAPSVELSLEAAPTPATVSHLNLQAHSIEFNDASIITEIQTALEKGQILLQYQQLYDKQDLNLNSYEVTSGFIFENKIKHMNGLTELDDHIELSIKVDRWILVEACKQLHNFITQYPEAKLIVNLNRHILLHDSKLPELVAKLITIVGSKLENPLILQFDEEDIAKNLSDSQRAIQALRGHGAEISVRRFGSTISSEAILKQTDINLICLDPKLSEMLNNDKSLAELQKKIDAYIEIKPVEILVKGLNDMGSFANAWNIEARFLQGEYFQKKLDHLTDVQDQ